ncbi:GPW/gp25 family protein [Variovorax sp. dw_954]|uniref:GPW/gp25 family protein n=1 Tax=Variovorax sp. dw_954 TaxID=2720078 RepID=UPI001BD363D7|nr:GPW/gp25 family protein [Variovorax sp. dw_954]
MNIHFPTLFDASGRTLSAGDDYLYELVEQVLFTSPGERVNLPDFGSGLLQLPFVPNSPELAAATQLTVQGALQKWLSGYLKVIAVETTSVEATLKVTVTYAPLDTGIPQVKTFQHGGNS